MKIQEVIVVEGKNDTQAIQRSVDADTIETHGTCLSEWTMKTIRQLQKKRGIIIFTDPDSPGDKIRQAVNQSVDGCKNAFLPQNKARGNHKIGVEHASSEDIREALKNCITYEKEKKESLSWTEFIELGLTGLPQSKALRLSTAHHFQIGEANAKTLFKRLNMLQVTKDQIQESRNHE